MLNTLKAKIIAGACAAAVVGGGVTAGVVISNNSKNKTESRPAVSTPANSSASAANTTSKPAEQSTPANNSTPTESSPSVSTPPQSVPQYNPVISEFGGFAFTFPDDYTFNYHINGSKGKYHIKNIDTEDAIFMQREAYTMWENDQKYQPEDVRDILFGKLHFINTQKNSKYGTVTDYFATFIPEYSEFLSVDEEEHLELDGCPFLRQQGILRLTKGYGGTYDVSYVAYYGVIPTKNYGEVPWVLFFHTASTKPEVIAEMRETAKTVMENGVYVGTDY